MKKMVLIAVIVVMLLSGCATWQAYTASQVTEEQKREAICQDAAAGLAMANTMLEQVLPVDAVKYWTAFAKGCSIAIQAYCGESCSTDPT